MPSELIISVSGLRGVVGKSLTTAVAERYALSFLATLSPGPIVVTQDGRANGPPLAEAVRNAVVRRGRICLDGGVAATPTTGVIVRNVEAVGGIQVSASHNPAQYNGLKLFNRAGRVIPASEGQAVVDLFRGGLTEEQVAAATRSPNIPTFPLELGDPYGGHDELVLATCDAERIASRQFRVVLDANFCSGAMLGVRLLKALGCEVQVLGGEPTGAFAHPPEPTEANLVDVARLAATTGADVCFCQDPDADRLAIIDERGRYIGEEKTFALCVDHVLRSGRIGPIVTNCSTSRMSEDLARRYGVPFFRSKVGEANVVDLMLAEGAILGGEGNGGVIDPRVGLVRDSFVGMALVLDAMAARQLPVSALADELPQYAIQKMAITLEASRVAEALDVLERALPEGQPDRLDGLRLDFADGAWLLVRPSNTEPIVRAIAEAPTAAGAKSLCERAAVALAG
jgi:phosphomannomutase